MKKVLVSVLVAVLLVGIPALVTTVLNRACLKKSELAKLSQEIQDNFRRVDINCMILKKTIEERTGGSEIPVNGKTQEEKKQDGKA